MWFNQYQAHSSSEAFMCIRLKGVKSIEWYHMYISRSAFYTKISGPENRSEGETHESRLHMNAKEAKSFPDTRACPIWQWCRLGLHNAPDGTATLPGKTGDSLHWEPANCCGDGLGHPTRSHDHCLTVKCLTAEGMRWERGRVSVRCGQEPVIFQA